MEMSAKRSRQLDCMVDEINNVAFEDIQVSDEGVTYSYNSSHGKENIEEESKNLKLIIQWSIIAILIAVMIVISILGSSFITGKYDHLFYGIFKNT